MDNQNIVQAAAIEAVKSAPPVAVTGAMIAGMTLSDWVTVLTGIYVLLQIAVLLRKVLRERRAERKQEGTAS